MYSIRLQKRFMVRFVRLKRLAKGDSRDYAPMTPISLLSRCSSRFERLRRFSKGDNRV